MTTGSWSTGHYDARSTHVHASKSWTGGDGWVIPTRYSSYKKWNPYLMAHAKFFSTQPNLIGYESKTDPVHNFGTADNNSFQMYDSFYGDGTPNAAFPTSVFNEYWDDNEELALLTKLLNKVKAHDADLGVALAEVDKLASTVANTLKSLAFGIEDLAHLRFAQFARRFGTHPPNRKQVAKLRLLDVPGRFLEARYAWTPAINDVFSVAKAFEEISNGPRQSRTRAARRKRIELNQPTNYGYQRGSIEVKRSYIFLQYEELGFARQLGLTNPATIIWERLPYSFVFDWFLPIGTYLGLIGQIPFMKGEWLRTSSVRSRGSGPVLEDPSPSAWHLVPPIPSAEWERFNLERSTTTSPPPVPTPNFRVHGAVQGRRVMNAIALASQFAIGIVTKHGLSTYGRVPDVTLSNI